MVTRSKPDPGESEPDEVDLNELNRQAAEAGVAATSAETPPESDAT